VARRALRQHTAMKKTIDVKSKLKIAFRLHQTGRLAEAAKIYGGVLRDDPANHQAANLSGLAALQSGAYVEAIELISTAVEAAPHNAGYRSNLGEAYRQNGQLGDAIQAFRKALALEPGLAGVDAKLGKALLDEGDGVKAISAFRRAVRIDPESADTFNNLAAAYVSQGLMTEAVASWRSALEVDSSHHQARSNLGVALRELGRLDEAIALYETSLQINADMPEAHCNFGVDLREKGDLAGAVRSLDRALVLKPGYVDALYMHALAHDFVEGDAQFERLRAAARSADNNDYQNILLNFALGKACDQIGCYDDAFANYRRGNDGMSAFAAYDAVVHRAEISDVIEAFPAVAAAAGAVEDGVTPIFVLGISRSGKTLVENVLASHGAVFAALEHGGWTKALNDKLFAKQIPRAFPAGAAGLSDPDIQDIGAAYRSDLAALSPDSRFIVNTSPGNYLYVGLILQAMPSARIDYCRRESLDNALFVYFSRYRRRHEYAYRLETIAAYFQDYDRLMAHWKSLYGARILDVQYEDLAAAPDSAARRLFEFCDLAEAPSINHLDFNTAEIGHWRRYARYLEDF
jgi:Flp pilus assembly protein TadD